VLSLRAPRTLAGGVTAALLVGGLAVASAGADDAPDPVAVAPAARQPAAIGAVQPAQSGTLRVLRRGRRASDAMPAGVAEAVAGPGRFGRNARLSRAIDTPTGTGWVVPGDDTVCIVVPDPVDGYGTSCSPTSVVAQAGLTVGVADEHGSTAVTLLPDDARLVLTDDDRSTDAVEPDASGVATVDATDADHLTVVTDEGRASTDLPDADELAGAPTP
jgi:hypothetical protein